MSESWFEIKNIKELDSPALVVFPERVKHNIQLAIDMIGDVDRLRPHIKTNKSPDVAKLMLMQALQNLNVQLLPKQKCLLNAMHLMFCWLTNRLDRN
jgi:D-serine deaminase-like pyridoxal phosphate-dependent protein